MRDFPNYEESEKDIFNLEFGNFHGDEDGMMHPDSQ